MSFNRLNYDTCEYKQTLAQSIGPGHYAINTPPVSCEACYPYPPSTRLQRSGDSVDMSKYMIDVDSEMLNITRAASKCPSHKFLPSCPDCICDSGEPCGQGVTNNCKSCKGTLKNGERCPTNYSKGLHHFPDCNIVPQEETSSAQHATASPEERSNAQHATINKQYETSTNNVYTVSTQTKYKRMC